MTDPTRPALPDNPLDVLGNPAPEPQGMLHDIPVEAYLLRSLELEPEVLGENLRNIGGHVAYWNARYAEAQRQFGHATRRRHELRARRRMELKVANPKATVDGLNDLLEMDDAYIAAQVECIDLEAQATRLLGYAKGVETNGRMAMTLGGLMREEFKGRNVGGG